MKSTGIHRYPNRQKPAAVGSESRWLLDIAANRRAQKYSAKDAVRRVWWGLGLVMFRWSPRPCFRWRRVLLRSLGAFVGQGVHIYPTARIYFPWNLAVGDWSAIGEDALIYNPGRVVIGERATVSHRAHLCAGTHDYAREEFPLVKAPVTIGDQAWICADAFVGPGVTVGEGAIVGARGVAVKDVAPWTIVAGNPARAIKRRIGATAPNETIKETSGGEG